MAVRFCGIQAMAQQLQAVRNEAMSLPTVDRAELALELLDSIDTQTSDGDAAEIEHAWIAEANRRYEQYLAGEVEAIPADEVFSNLRAKLN